MHITLRLGSGLPSLRSQLISELVRRAFRDTWRRWFRIVHYSIHPIQSNHLHLIAEADDAKALSRGSSAIEIRIARRLNALLQRRGTVFPQRYHAHPLKSPREVRNALAYVLLNAHKHNVMVEGLDPYSSGSAFDGWRDVVPEDRAPAPVHSNAVIPRTWLLAHGWRRHGLIASWERPGAHVLA